MTGRELIEWSIDSKAEDSRVLVVDSDFRYLDVQRVWAGEFSGGSVMLEVSDKEAE